MPAPLDKPPGTRPLQRGRPMGHGCQPKGGPYGNFGMIIWEARGWRAQRRCMGVPQGNISGAAVSMATSSSAQNLMGPDGWCNKENPQYRCPCTYVSAGCWAFRLAALREQGGREGRVLRERRAFSRPVDSDTLTFHTQDGFAGANCEVVTEQFCVNQVCVWHGAHS